MEYFVVQFSLRGRPASLGVMLAAQAMHDEGLL